MRWLSCSAARRGCHLGPPEDRRVPHHSDVDVIEPTSPVRAKPAQSSRARTRPSTDMQIHAYDREESQVRQGSEWLRAISSPSSSTFSLATMCRSWWGLINSMYPTAAVVIKRLPARSRTAVFHTYRRANWPPSPCPSPRSGAATRRSFLSPWRFPPSKAPGRRKASALSAPALR